MATIDAERWLTRIKEDGLLGLEELEVDAETPVPGHVAAIGKGRRADGAEVIVSFAPRYAGDALLGGLAAAGARAGEDGGFTGEVIAVAPQWTGAARRRLALLRDELPFTVTAVTASSLEEGPTEVPPEPVEEHGVTTPARLAAHMAEGAERDLYLRALAALEGLGSKHGGGVRAYGRGVELVVLSRRVAQLRLEEGGGLSLVTLAPQRSSTRLDSAGLAAAFDALEGQLRKRINDRRTRDGEEGVRTQLLPVAAEAVGLRGAIAFPLGGSDVETLDQIGVDATGRPVIVAVRLKLGLAELGRILDSLQDLRPHLSTLLAYLPPPVRVETPRLVLVAEELDAAVAPALAGLAVAHDVFTLDRERGLQLLPGASGAAGRAARGAAGRRRRRGRGDREEAAGEGARGERGARDESRPAGEEAPAAGREAAEQAVSADAEEAKAGDDEAREEGRGDEAGRGRSRRRRGGRGRGRARDRDEAGPAEGAEDADAGEGQVAASAEDEDRGPKYESLSLLDLDDESGDDAEDGGARRRGRGGRRRGRRGTGSRGEGGEGGDEASVSGDDERPRARADAGSEAEAESESGDEDDTDADDLDDSLADLPESLAGVGDPLQYAEDEDEDEDAGGDDKSRRTREREERRRARKAQNAEISEPAAPRRRAVVVACADRDSLLAAVLLARDIRLLEGIWVYPQSELMTFFRSVATDVKEDVPIYVVGFTPSPARDVIQAASLYANRITWFDHHDWPPEDLSAVRETFREDALHLAPGTGSSLPAVLETSTRRSRFSDKLVDLATGRFSQHDYERWGRLWWHRLGEISAKGGEVRADIDPLLSGRPSDLAKEALKVDAPPLPAELEYVSSRDFRLVRFAGHAMVVVDVDGDCDPLLAARIARERYRANLSLAFVRGSELVLFGGEETGGRRTLDFGALSEHLANKFRWVEALPDTDHVARFRVRGLNETPERMDEVVGTIAMGRSILEG